MEGYPAAQHTAQQSSRLTRNNHGCQETLQQAADNNAATAGHVTQQGPHATAHLRS